MTKNEAYAAAGIEIQERDGDTIRAAIQTDTGSVIVVADLIRLQDRLIVDGAHVDGEGLDLPLIRQLAQSVGEIEDVVEVIVQGGVRTSGARPGSSPTPIRVKVKR